MVNKKAFKKAPTTWGALYDPKNKGKITIPDNPIQIADAALYLSKKDPSLGIKDPYELNDKQFQAAVEGQGIVTTGAQGIQDVAQVIDSVQENRVASAFGLLQDLMGDPVDRSRYVRRGKNDLANFTFRLWVRHSGPPSPPHGTGR